MYKSLYFCDIQIVQGKVFKILSFQRREDDYFNKHVGIWRRESGEICMKIMENLIYMRAR